MSEARQTTIHHSAIREQLEKLLAHGLFSRSGRMSRFLRLTVEQTLAGNGDSLKEYLIGVEVFDRKSSYDPRVEPIVRVEARRLRAKLKQYYEGDGRDDPIRIEYSPGSYAPHFCAQGEAAAAERPPAPGVVTTAVLPFANLSANSENEYFSDGLTEELIHALTKVPGLRVVAWNTAARLRDSAEDLRAIRAQLQVQTVLTGSVRIAGQSLRVRAQLIDTESGQYLWSETFDRKMQDVFAIQEEIAANIVRTLRVQLTAPAGRTRTTIGSYDWYLKGRYLQHHRTPEDMRRSIQCFENALAADPNSALAHAGLADSYSLLVDYGLLYPLEGLPRARAAAEQAVALDPDLAEGHASLAFLRGIYDWNWDDAERHYNRAIALNPGYAPAHHWLAVDHCAMLGQFDRAQKEIEIAIQLDPLSSITREGRGMILTLMRRYPEAIEAYRQLQASDPSFYKAYTSIGRAFAQIGRYDEAIAMLNKGRVLAGNVPNIIAATGQVYAVSGHPDRARELLGELDELARGRHVPMTAFAVIELGLGECQKALDYLEKGCDGRESGMAALKVHPLYDPLRADPRFHALMRRLGFER